MKIGLNIRFLTVLFGLMVFFLLFWSFGNFFNHLFFSVLWIRSTRPARTKSALKTVYSGLTITNGLFLLSTVRRCKASRKVLSVWNIFRIELKKIISLFFSVSIWATTVSTSMTFCGKWMLWSFLRCTKMHTKFHFVSMWVNRWPFSTWMKKILENLFCWKWSRDLNSGPTNTKTFFVTYIDKSDIQVIWKTDKKVSNHVFFCFFILFL